MPYSQSSPATEVAARITRGDAVRTKIASWPRYHVDVDALDRLIFIGIPSIDVVAVCYGSLASLPSPDSIRVILALNWLQNAPDHFATAISNHIDRVVIEYTHYYADLVEGANRCTH